MHNVTLVMIDDVSERMAYAAIEDTARQVEVDHTVGISRNVTNYEETLWYGIPSRIETSHALIIQYDGFVLDGSRWNPSWLEYDYIGAPWPWHSEFRVGNGGFSLRSRRLMNHLAENSAQYPIRSPEDDSLCRYYRPRLELSGFRWAPESVAREFSFERGAPRPTFGFHGLFNFPHVMDYQRLVERIGMANDYVRSKPEWTELIMFGAAPARMSS